MSADDSSAQNSLEQSLKRCRPEVLKASQDYRATHDAKFLPTIVIGILERFVEPDKRSLLQGQNVNDLKLQADLGMDSLVMVEVVMTFEEVLQTQIPDTELRGLHTIGDTLDYVQAKATGSELPTPPDRLMPEMLPMLVGSQSVLISDVVLRPTKAEAVYSGSEPSSADNLIKAAAQLAEIWGQRKGVSQALTPKTAINNLIIDSSLPVQLRLEKEQNAHSWNAFWLQTGKTPVLFATL